MRKVNLLIGVAASVFCLSLASCNDNTFNRSKVFIAEGFEASRDAFRECASKTFAHENMTVTWYDHNAHADYTERILGDSSYIVEKSEIYSEETKEWFDVVTSETWCFVNEEGERIVAKKESPWSEEDRQTTQYYFRGNYDYKKNYKSYIKLLDVVEKHEDWFEPYASTEVGKQIYENTTIDYWRLYSPTMDEEDYFDYSVTYSKRTDCCVSIYGLIDPKTELFTKLGVLIDMPDGCSDPYEGKCVWFSFGKIKYNENKDLAIPDISGWERRS